MTTSNRNRIMDGTADIITTALVAAFGAQCACVRGFTDEQPENTLPENTPRAWLWELDATTIDDDSQPYGWPIRELRFQLIGVVRMTSATAGDPMETQAGPVQAVLDDMEAVFDVLLTTTVVAGLAPSFIPDGPIVANAGDAEGWIVYPLRVRYPRV
ncbi:MAG: hypothetical protein PHU75_03850 [Candidatus Nanopelagicales bacterium]|nr:hypothetical protein [Candidatus Nanopelagicales bacterium]